MNDLLLNSIQAAVQSGDLLAATAANIQHLLEGAISSLEERVIQELVDRKEWKELNDRFFKTLAFGTGGLRGKTIGNVITFVEQGNKSFDGRPEFACIGTNCVNNYNIVRATRGLVTYVMQWHKNQKRSGRPKICISYDTRFFSREFADLTSKVITEHGCDALMFESPRSTPELSFAVRHCNATAGINITASHNPPAYNGYKVYFEDGGQIIEPHASSIIKLVDSMQGEKYEPLPAAEQGEKVMLGEEIDKVYKERLKTLVLEPSLFQNKLPLKVVYTPLHGVGGVIIVPLLQELGMTCLPVESQMKPDGWFSTVKSPNPENAEALTLGIALANQKKADLVLATDPDDDRMGVAVRNAAGEMELLTGNQIGSLLLWYRLKQLFAKGILSDQNKKRAVVIKSLVTTELQTIIAEKSGVRCVETLTGFKYIGAKQEKYEKELAVSVQASYRQLNEAESREARLHASSYFIFGGEESYGYNMGDFVRDKDGNAAVLCFCEVAAYAASQGLSLIALLDQIYSEFGLYLERGESLTFEGAEGADKMKRLMESYTKKPFEKINGIPVISRRDFDAEDLCDSEGEVYPKEAMLMIDLMHNSTANANSCVAPVLASSSINDTLSRCAPSTPCSSSSAASSARGLVKPDCRVVIRPSGTEPKIKFYLFTARRPTVEKFSLEEVQKIKPELKEELEKLWQWLKEDLEQRIRGE